MFMQIHNHIMRIDTIESVYWSHNEERKEWTITVEFNTDRPAKTFYFENEKSRNECIGMVQTKLSP